MPAYLYKDAYRDWWKLSIEKSHPEPDPDDQDIVDWWWTYDLSKQDDSTGDYVTAFAGDVQGQYEIEPKITEVLAEVACRITRLAISWSSTAHLCQPLEMRRYEPPER